MIPLWSVAFSIMGWCLPIAGNYLDFVNSDGVLYFSELHIVQNECPDVITETIRIQLTLEHEPILDSVSEGCVDGFVKLQQHFQSKLGRDLTTLYQFVQALLKCITKSCISVQLVIHFDHK